MKLLVPIESRGGEAVGEALDRAEVTADRVPALVAEHGALLVRGESLNFPVPWRDGDLLLLDNRRFMRGRRAFEGERAILTRFIKRPAGDPTAVPRASQGRER